MAFNAARGDLPAQALVKEHIARVNAATIEGQPDVSVTAVWSCYWDRRAEDPSGQLARMEQQYFRCLYALVAPRR